MNYAIINGQRYDLESDEIEYIITRNTLRKEYESGNFSNLRFYDDKMAVGKSYGTSIEKFIKNDFFTDLTNQPKGETSYDALFGDIRIEIKSTRAVLNERKEYKTKNTALFAADISIDNFHTLSPFQQIKPYCCDWFILHILFKNHHRFFFVPSSCIQECVGEEYIEDGKIYLGSQHRDSKREGSIPVERILKHADIFEIPQGITSFEVGMKIVKENLEKNGWLI